MLDAIEAEKQAKFESEARFRKLVKVLPIPLAYPQDKARFSILMTASNSFWLYT